MKPTTVLIFLAIGSTTLAPLANGDTLHPTPSGITVTGECLKKVSQDRGAVTVGTSIVAQKASAAAERAIEAHEHIKVDVAKLKLKDSTQQTANYSVSEECTYNGGKRLCTGYRANISTRFETSDIPRLGDVIAVAAQHGSEDISQLQTFVSREKLKESREACLETATQNAAAKALKLATGAGVKLGKLLSLSENTAPGGAFPIYQRNNNMEMKSMSLAASAPSIDSQAEDLQVSVSANYNIE